MTQFTAFGKTVKKSLIDRGQTQTWLSDEIYRRTGLFVDNGYLYKIFTGQRSAPKICAAIRDILDIQEPDAMKA